MNAIPFLAEPFHAGELRAQILSGAGRSGAAIRGAMPDQHREFFADLPFVLVGAVDEAGWPMATVLAGPPGFVDSPDPHHLAIAALPRASDPVAPLLRRGTRIGLLGIDLATRRRNRANGIIETATAGTLGIAVQESFGNCPKYIHRRALRSVPAQVSITESLVTLDDAARQTVANADTAFVATTGGPLGGADISHRGGPVGFISMTGDTLTIPDYRGNRYYNTLGNLLVEPRAALLLVNFATGDVLLLRGTAEIDWRTPNQAEFPGAERLWRLHADRGWRQRNAVPLRWSAIN